MAGFACEYLNDLLVAAYAKKWIAFPDLIKTTITERLRTKKGTLEAFFKDL